MKTKVSEHYEFRTSRIRVPMTFSTREQAIAWLKMQTDRNPRYAGMLTFHHVKTTIESTEIAVINPMAQIEEDDYALLAMSSANQIEPID